MGQESKVSLQIAARHSQVRLARLVAAGIASLEGFDLEAVEDLRIAVDEGCVWLIDHSDGGTLELEFAVDDGGTVVVSGETEHAGKRTEGALGELAAQILAASCAEHRFEVDGTRARFVLVARSASFRGAPATADDGPATPDDGSMRVDCDR